MYRRYSVMPRTSTQITIDAALLKLLQAIVPNDYVLNSSKNEDDCTAELAVSRHGRVVFAFAGNEEVIEPLVDICELWSKVKGEFCPSGIDRAHHRDALIRRLLERAICGEDAVPKWLHECSLQDVSHVLYLVQYADEPFSLEDVGSLF